MFGIVLMCLGAGIVIACAIVTWMLMSVLNYDEWNTYEDNNQ